MSSDKELYFIALMPPPSLAEKIYSIKEEIAKKYNSKHSLKVPEHITIIPPFRCDEDQLDKVVIVVTDFSKTISSFKILLKNFGHFGHKIIFIEAFSRPENALPDLYNSLKKCFENELSFVEGLGLKDEFHSHLTIANRDLKKPEFDEVWPEFKERKFEESFRVNSLFLLNHPDNIWRSFKEFHFKN